MTTGAPDATHPVSSTQARRDWTSQEISIVVAAYLMLLHAELAGHVTV